MSPRFQAAVVDIVPHGRGDESLLFCCPLHTVSGGGREPTLKTALAYSAVYRVPVEELWAGALKWTSPEWPGRRAGSPPGAGLLRRQADPSPGLAPRAAKTEGKRVVQELIRDLDPDVLAYEKTFVAKNRNTALLNVLADEIVSLAERQGLKVLGVAPTTVKKRVTGNGRASKREVAEAVAAIYPELKAYLPNGKGSGFRANLFDAVGGGGRVLEVHSSITSKDSGTVANRHL